MWRGGASHKTRVCETSRDSGGLGRSGERDVRGRWKFEIGARSRARSGFGRMSLRLAYCSDILKWDPAPSRQPHSRGADGPTDAEAGTVSSVGAPQLFASDGSWGVFVSWPSLDSAVGWSATVEGAAFRPPRGIEQPAANPIHVDRASTAESTSPRRPKPTAYCNELCRRVKSMRRRSR